MASDSGLASHFRDLLVCKDQRTIDLLEVGDKTKAKYFEQSQKTDSAFLLKGIALANQCDFEYKNSRNQRLLVELCLMQLASLDFDPEKKKDKPFIIPASEFTQGPIPAPAEAIPKKDKTEPSEKETLQTSSEPASENISSEEVRKPKTDFSNPKNKNSTETPEAKSEADLNEEKAEKAVSVATKSDKKVSGLSLKSIQKKREIQAQQKKAKANDATERHEDFTEAEMHAAWKEFVQHQHQKGEKILASIMQTDLPKLDDKKILLELPNDTMKVELERAQFPLMVFLKQKLQNTGISLQIKVNEKIEEKYAFTPREKYEKLKEKNPLIEDLRTTFDLDI